MKSPAVLQAKVDPFVYQTWKTLVFFSTSWLVLAFKPFSFTAFGFLSGLSWVPGGALAVVGVQNAGLASALGVVQGTIVLVSFVWSLMVFHEPMWSVWLTLVAVAALATGIVGMSYALRPAPQHKAARLIQDGEAGPEALAQDSANDGDAAMQVTQMAQGLRVQDITIALL